ncbi:MAG: hypothetical protein VW541_03860 [Pelagibacteraceae bacterium]
MLTTYSNQLNIKKIRGIIFLGFLFWLIASPSSAFFHNKDKNETEVEITEDLYSQMQDIHVEAAAENLLIALETKADNQKHRWVKGSYEGYIIPFSTFINDLGYFCRDYVEVIVKNGSRYNVFENFACRDHDGEWVWIQTKSANKSERM